MTDRAARVGLLQDGITACLAEVVRYMRLPEAQRHGRPLLLAFAAVQRHGRLADRLADHGHPLPPGRCIPAPDALAISRAMGRVAARVAVLPSISKPNDFPALRGALGLGVTQAQAEAAERNAMMVRAVALNLRRVVDAGLTMTAEPDFCGPRHPNRASLIVGKMSPKRKPVHAHLQSIFVAVGDGFHCHPGTVRKAWLAGRAELEALATPEAQAELKARAELEALAVRAWAVAATVPAPSPAAKVRKPQDRSKMKAAINRDLWRE